MLLVLLLLALFLLVLLGFYVFVAAPRSRTHATFTVFVLCLALWAVKDIVLWGFAPPRGSILWWANASFALALLLQYSLVIFAWIFPEDSAVPWRRVAILVAPGAVLVPALLLGWMWKDARIANGELDIRLTPLAYAFGAYVYSMFAYGSGMLWLKYRRYKGTLWGQQLGAILWGLAITGVFNTLANVVLPLYGDYRLLPFGSVFVLPGVLVYAYAISNFQLFSLQSALDQFRLFPVAYKVALSIACVAIVSFVILQVPIVWWSFGTQVSPEAAVEAWRRYLVFSVIAALAPNLVLVALVIRTISRPVRRLTEAAVAVAGGAYGAQVDLHSNDEVGLLARSFNEMSSKLQADIERLRQMGDHLVRTEKLAAAGTLAAGVAHEVNNPLASISSLIQILQKQHTNDAEAVEMLRLMQTQVERISRVLRDMMDFARVRPPSRQPIDLPRIIDASVRLASFDKSFKRLTIKTDYDQAAPLVLADADQLQQVMLNVLLNARDAMPDGGRVHIATRYAASENEVVMTITDSGGGIAPEHVKRIFDPFFTTKPAGAGTGLGLAVCYRLIAAHDGRIEIDAPNGCGTTVRITLPVQ